ncbi:MAG: hypothetical protein JO197_08490 [Acidobacteria bacterium]|nr:hypothetical protein [Acidobacteriota bacterium]
MTNLSFTGDNSILPTVLSDLTTFAETMASFALMAAGPVGMLGAGVLAGVLQIHNSSQAQAAQQALLTNIQSDVTQAIQNEVIRGAAATIDSYRTAFNTNLAALLQPYLSGKQPIPPDPSNTTNPEFNDQWKNFEQSLTGEGNGLQQALATLQQADSVTTGVNFQVQAFATFLAGAALQAYLYGIYVAMVNGAKNRPANQGVIDEYADSILANLTAAVATVDYINSQLNQRMALISDLTSTNGGWSFTDTGAPAPPAGWNAYSAAGQYFIPGGVTGGAQRAAGDLNTYKAWVSALFMQDYSINGQMISALCNLQKTYASLTAHSEGKE